MNEVNNTAPVDASTNDTNEGVEAQETVINPDTDPSKFKELAENYRIRAEKAEAKLKEAKSTPTQTPTFDPDVIKQTLKEELESERLAEMQYPDEIKGEIKLLAGLKGVSVKEAAKNPYIQSLVQEHERAERVKSASPDTSGGATTSYTFNPENPPEVDLTTPEGQEAMLKWEQTLEKHNNKRFG